MKALIATTLAASLCLAAAPPDPERFQSPRGLAAFLAQKEPKAASLPKAVFTTKPVLTGSEGITLWNIRSFLEQNNPYEARFMTAQDVRDFVAESEPDGIMAQMVSEIYGWSALVWNWSYATLMGDAEQARSFLIESVPVAPGNGIFGDIDQLGQETPENGSYSLSDRSLDLLACGGRSDAEECMKARIQERREREEEISAEALLWSMILSQRASVFASESELLSDATDPEGFIRQRLRYASRELWRASETVFVIAQVAE